MKLSESTSQKLEHFFREYLEDENFKLPTVYFYTGRFAGIFTRLIRVEGITIGKHIFVLPERLRRNSNNEPRLSENLVAHEVAHVLQYRREGFIRFIYKYLRDYYKNLYKEKIRNDLAKIRAYQNIPFEIEAREIAKEFCRRNRE